MKVAPGSIVYEHGAIPCSGTGRVWSDGELENALAERVAGLVFDETGDADVREILRDLAFTEFEQNRVRDVLSNTSHIKDWRVGEAIAEAYLTDHRDCHFPWPVGRDERKRGSSLPGADLVGFQTDDNGDVFAFGEVKTSREASYPPSVVHGRTGLRRQLEDLRDDKNIKEALMKYLGHRAYSAPWRPRFREAFRRYLKNGADFRLHGVLIRDVDPNENDLKSRTESLAMNCPEGTEIELLALYLPNGRINGLGAIVVNLRSGDVI